MSHSPDTGGEPAPPASPRKKGRAAWWLVTLAVLVVAGGTVLLKARTSPPPAAVTALAPATVAPALPADGVVAYYFHTTYRCTSCRKIEAYSRVAIETGFAAEIAGGSLQFCMVNIEDGGNEHFVEDYKLYTKSLVLSERAGGREVRWKNLTRVWQLLNDEPAFVDYVQDETREYLAAAP